MRTAVDAITGPQRSPATLTVAGLGAHPDTVTTWAGLHERARRMAAGLAMRGVAPGSRVGLLADTSVQLVTAIQAVWLRGAAFTVLPPLGRAGRQANLAHLQAIVAHADFTLLLTDETLLLRDETALPRDETALLRDERALLRDERALLTGEGVLLGDEGALLAGEGVSGGLGGRVRVCSLSALYAESAVLAPATPVLPEPGDLAILQYTSGSTSSPRGVPVTHANLAANLDAMRAVLGDALDPVKASWMSWLPLYHDMGLIGFVCLPMTHGCPLVLQPPGAFALRPATWLDRMARHRVTSTGGPNFAFGLLTQLLEAGAPADLSSVRHMFCGGEPIDAAMMARFVDAAGQRGLDPGAVVASYGLAESTLAVSFSPLGRGIVADDVDGGRLEREGLAVPGPGRRLVGVGQAVPGTRIRIADETGTVAAARAVGHIELCGPSVVGGYWGEPARPSPWLRTGDLGYLSEDGQLVVCGRAKDVLFAAGRNIYPQDVEAAALAVQGVRPGGAAAFGVSAGSGDRLIVAVETRAGDSEALRKAVAVAVASQTGMAPADVVTLRFGRLPKTSSGKLRRAETRRRYLAGELTDRRPTLVDRSVR